MTEPGHDPHSTHHLDPIRPQARAFQGLRAGIVTRTLAGSIDYLVVAGFTLGTWVAYVVLKFLIDPRNFVVPTWPFIVFVVYGYVLMVLYLTVGWATSGRSLGSRLVGLRVVGRKGAKLTWPGAFVRAVLCTLVPVALFWCAISRENRSLQDILLRTSVIHDWPVRAALRFVDAEDRSEL